MLGVVHGCSCAKGTRNLYQLSVDSHVSNSFDSCAEHTCQNKYRQTIPGRLAEQNDRHEEQRLRNQDAD